MFLTVLMIIQVIAPMKVFALTSGPAQPEFASFEPVSTVKMVDEFSGALTYNLPLLEIPGPEGGSYPLSLSYHSGTTPSEDASWVGFGWTLNPGAIQRGKAGYPDDYNGEKVIDYNRVPDNWTVGIGPSHSTEIFGTDLVFGYNASIRYNNYRGFGLVQSANVSIPYVGSLGYSLSDGDGSFSFRINPGNVLGKEKEKHEKGAKRSDQNPNTQEKMTSKKLLKLKRETKKNKKFRNIGFSVPGRQSRPTSVTPYTGLSVNFSISAQANLFPAPAGIETGISGSYSSQHNVGELKKPAYGYLYSANATEESLMDYYTERLSTYEKRDHYLGIPFSSADNFSATGAALSGSFRAHSKRTGYFHPNLAHSHTPIVQGGLEFMAGPNSGIGWDIGVGYHNMTVKEWENSGYNFSNAGDEPYFFRFGGDMGGAMDIGSSIAETGDPTVNVDAVQMPTTIPYGLNSGRRVSRSSYVGYTTNNKISETYGGTGHFKNAYTNDASIVNNALIDRQGSPEGIGEFSIVNSGGVRYNYGIPVYAQNENSLSYLIRKASASAVDQNFSVHDAGYTKDEARYVVGREMSKKYASQFLLTEVLQPDYLDRTLNGPTDDDFGGWTKFSYSKVYGSGMGDGWYKWRMPYTGMSYDRNELSSDLDDVGTVSFGEKEIYYLDKIETKTHIANFYLSEREDGYDAEHSEAVACSLNTAKGSNPLKRLDRIELWRKGSNGQALELIKTVHFEYDYSSWSCGSLPNSNAGKGKLTLRKVWFDYEGTVNARISPYEFYYQYPRTGNTSPAACTAGATTNLPDFVTVDYPSKYNMLEDYGSGLNETPSYNPMDVDPWGNYQENGGLRHNQFKPWMNQVPSSTFDPAAYQLKTVKFPSGGQIHLQYEQNEYRWVQDRYASAMVGITEAPSDPGDPGYPITSHNYYLNTLTDLGISATDPRTDEIVQMIREVFINKRQKIYFKFLYSLFPLSAPNINNCDVEFIDGYVTVNDVYFDTGANKIKLKIGPNTSGTYDYPKDVCNDLLRTSKRGNIQPGVSCDASSGALNNAGSPISVFMNLGAMISTLGVFSGCGNLDPTNSYFRIPIPGKKGGGIRVKRILMYDKGLESGGEDKALYGTEYEYTDEFGKSSGVITKEPGVVSCEDPLITLLDRSGQSAINRIIAGKDRKEMEGPLGETIIPEMGVGYGRVLAKSIHSGRTSPGYTVNEYFTCKDYPFDGKYSYIPGEYAIDATPIKVKRSFIPEIAGIIPITYGKDNRYMAQGYRFVQYDIHGQPKRFSTYAGSYDVGQNVMSPTGLKLVASQSYTYFKPGDILPMMDEVEFNGNTNGWYPGKEAEIVTESRQVNDISVNAHMEYDGSISFLGLLVLPIITVMPNINYSEHRMKTHVTTKIERYPAIQKSVASYQDGITHVTENIAFNPETGSPILTKTYDSYNGLIDLEVNGTGSSHDGTYHSYVIPASREYVNLKGKYKTERLTLPAYGVGFTIDKVNVAGVTYLQFVNQGTGSNPILCEVLSSLCEGSRVEVATTLGASPGTDGIYTLGKVNGNLIELLGSAFYAKDLQGTTAQEVKMTVLKSGCSNRLDESVGAFTTYGGIAQVGSNQASTFAENQAREATFAAPLNSLLTGLSNGGSDALAVSTCVFKNTYSDDIEIRLNTTVSGSGSILTIELVDWANGAAISRCVETVPNFEGGTFQISELTGELIFMPNGSECHPFKLPCLEFCENNSVTDTIPNVVVAEAVTLSQAWPYSLSLYGSSPANANAYESGELGKWRQLSSYKFRTNIIGGAQDNPVGSSLVERNYDDAGVFPLELFNYQDYSANDSKKWLLGSTVTQYSPNGMAIEEVDILNTYGAAHFGYNFTVPIMTAKNSNYDKCYFESFEMEYGTSGSGRVEEGVIVNSTSISGLKAHAGKQSYLLDSPLQLRPFTLDIRAIEHGFSFMVWVQDDKFSKDAIQGSISHAYVNIPLDFKWLAKTGEWSLYEAKIQPSPTYTSNWGNIAAGANIAIEIHKNPNLVGQIWVDDIRYQPLDAQAACYVYDPNTLKPLVTFDDQHFGMYNQYDGEGKLVRKLIETERGMRTVQETQIHTPTKFR